MQNFFLFIDTETSGLPKNWKAPYAKEKNWPHIVQISWIVFDHNFKEVKRENHYINNTDFTITKAAQKIHGISDDYRLKNGEDLKKVMSFFCKDINEFSPLIVGHFVELDYHMVNVSLTRLEMPNVFKQSTFYCTMKTSADYVTNSVISHLKLDKFFTILFNEEPEQMHNALADALNTSKIFFHLLTSQKISLNSVYCQDHSFNKPADVIKKSPFKRFMQQLFHG